MLTIKATLSHQIPVSLQINQLQLRMFKPFHLLGFYYRHHHLPHHPIIQHNYNCKFQIIKAVVVGRTPSPSMEDDKEPQKTDTQNHTPTAVKENDKEKEKEKLQPPTPPEKPEPGDCCGSGCVRCVWDVYYDQLDAYNQLLTQFKDQPSN